MSSAFESDPTSYTPQVDNEIIEHLHEELSPQEQKVFRYMKTPGATQGKTGLIAKQLKWSPSKVSRLRKAIEAKATHYKNVLGK
jgi:DNA-directed RNA polymerase specialized sigma subunit